MSSKEHVHNLMLEIGPALELMEVTEFDEDNLWVLVRDEACVIEVEYDDDQKRIMLSTEIGQPHEADRKNIYEMLLQVNYLWQETGGLRIGLDGPVGKVVQMFGTSVIDLHLGQLKTILTNFFDSARTWHEIISQGGLAEKEVAEKAAERPPPPEGDLSGAIKV